MVMSRLPRPLLRHDATTWRHHEDCADASTIYQQTDLAKGYLKFQHESGRSGACHQPAFYMCGFVGFWCTFRLSVSPRVSIPNS